MRLCVSVILALMATAAAASDDGEIESRVEAILGKMSVEEKIDLVGGVDFFYLQGVPRLGVPRLRMMDGPMGVRNDGPATAFGGGIALAATWNTDLLRRAGVEFGRDTRAKGGHFLLAPGVNIYRAPVAARNFEYFGEDPFLAARLAVSFIEGVQSQGVAATIKHFVANNSEFDRNNTDSVVDERTLREIYLPAFEAAVKEARVGAIMDGYNLTNGLYMSQHRYLNVDLVKQEWGFDGVIMSDWISTYDAIGAANGGLDIEMPSGAHLNRENLLPALESGEVSMATLDDKVRRILRIAARFGWLDREQRDTSIPRYNTAAREVALQGAREGIVLLRNENGALPLDRERVDSILVVGPHAHPAVTGGGGSSKVEPFTAVSILEGMVETASKDLQVFYATGLATLDEMVSRTEFSTTADNGTPGLHAEYFATGDLSGDPVLTRVEPRIAIGSGRDASPYPEGTLSERWTGFYIAERDGTYDFFVTASGDGGGFYRLFLDGALVLDNWSLNRAIVDYVTLELDSGAHEIVFEHHGRQKWPGARLELGISRHGDRITADARELAARVDAVVVAAGFDASTESEGADRTFRLPPGQDELIRAMADANDRTIVVMTSGGAVEMTGWLDRVPALLQAWYPGQEGGTAVAGVLLGDVNPSGRLPATFERRREDNPAYDNYYPEPGTQRILYEEGVFVGYRGFEHEGIAPLFPFGHGLSYTTFEYGGLEIEPRTTRDGNVSVSLDVTNTGDRAGAEVVQVYVADAHSAVPRPPKELKGFARVRLEPGETRRVTIELDRRSFAYYDTGRKRWAVAPGVFGVLVGRSSTAIELRGDVAFSD
jgi:beta-glucosidase